MRMFDRASWLVRLVRLSRLASPVLAALLVVSLVVSGCGRSTLAGDGLIIIRADGGLITCAPGCTGCCERGVCVAGTELSACGAGGEACANCSRASTAATCQANAEGGAGGACVAIVANCDCPAGETCDPSTGACISPSPCGVCAGCCVGTECMPGSRDAQCGVAGGSCAACDGNQVCAPGTAGGGVCVSSTCDGMSCAGCCGANGCEAGTLVSSCGTLGQACEGCGAGQCAPAGPSNGGVCVATGCNTQNCPGCCDANALCQAGTAARLRWRRGELRLVRVGPGLRRRRLRDAGRMRSGNVRWLLRGEHLRRWRRKRRMRRRWQRVRGLRDDGLVRRECVPDARPLRRLELSERLLQWQPVPPWRERFRLRLGRSCVQRLRSRNAVRGRCRRRRRVQGGRGVWPVELLRLLRERHVRGRRERDGVRSRRQPVPGVRGRHSVCERFVRSDVRPRDMHGVLPGGCLRARRPEQCLWCRWGRLPELRKRAMPGGHVRRTAVQFVDVRRLLRLDRRMPRRRGSGRVRRGRKRLPQLRIERRPLLPGRLRGRPAGLHSFELPARLLRHERRLSGRLPR